jgi:glycosyltransferase involved in cell wall biosynthesis
MITTVDRARQFHVGLNAHLLSMQDGYRSAGSSWYIYNMLCHLPIAAPELQYTAFLHDPRFSPPQGMGIRRSSWSTVLPSRRIAWEQLVAPVALRRERVDLLHAMAFVAPVLSPCPTIVTVFDLSFLLFPEAFKPANRLYLRLMARLSVQRAARVITISSSTQRDVMAWLGAPAERVRTVYCGVDPHFHPLPMAEVDAFRRARGLPERFIFFLGTIEPRKNVLRLVDAFADLIALDLKDLHLIVAGGRGWLSEPVFARVEELGLEDRVHFPGYVPEEEKRLWYNAATCFCFPSLYEGFGLPPLEAMACGVPVIASNVSSLPEVVGDAGITVSPEDRAALTGALHRLLVDPALRKELAARGLARARRFSWTEAARETADIYHQVWEEASYGSSGA